MCENETTEFKKTLGQLKEGIISIAAILNKHGEGELWFGIRDDGIPVGINVGAKTIRDISQAIAAHIEPKIYPEITTEMVEGIQCVKVLFSGQETPYAAYGRQYMRVGDEDRQMSAKELEKFFSRRSHAAGHWDSEPCKATFADLSEKKVRAFVERAELSWHSLPVALENLDLLKGDQLVNAAPVFFGAKPSLKLRCAVFGTDTTSFIIDRRDFEGDILELVEEAQQYILKNIHIGMRLEGLYRVDVPEIAIPALREAIINAFCHRDYRDPEHVQVAVFKNRVEIRNPGTLFGGLTLDALRQGRLSRRRNPLIAQLLTRIHMMEAWGRGMSLILENEPEARFEELAGMFIASFARTAVASDELATKNGPAATTTKATTETTIKTATESAGKTHASLSPQAITILQLIKNKPTIQQDEIAANMGLTKDGVRYHMDKLKKKGMLHRVGGSKNGHWEIVMGEGYIE